MPVKTTKKGPSAPVGDVEPETTKDLLYRTLERLKTAVFSEDTPPRDLASLTRRMLEVSREIERVEGEEGSMEPAGRSVDEEAFDPDEI